MSSALMDLEIEIENYSFGNMGKIFFLAITKLDKTTYTTLVCTLYIFSFRKRTVKETDDDNEKPRCEICHKDFDKRSRLVRHMKSHISGRRYKVVVYINVRKMNLC